MMAKATVRGSQEEERPIAAVYRDRFLPRSETFVRDHLLGLRRYSGRALAGWRVEGGLDVPGIEVTEVRSSGMVPRVVDGIRRRAGVEGHELRSIALAHRVRELRPAVLHAHFGVDGAIARRAAVHNAVPFVVTFHGYDASMRPDALVTEGGASRHMIETWEDLVRDMSAVITVSEALRVNLVARGIDSRKVSVIPCGVRTDQWRFSLPPTDGPLLFVGRLVEKKGCSDLLEALSGIPEAPLLRVLGDGPLRADLEAQARRLRVKVDFEGVADSRQVADAVRACRFVVMPSRTAHNGDTEGLPVVSLEASASGRPVVGYRHSGLVESVLDGVTGVLVPEGDVPSLQRAISGLLVDDQRLALYARHARQHVEAHFELVDCIDRVEDVYDRVIASRTARYRGKRRSALRVGGAPA
jgi:colanic acid/amylovoran biosynthesis glycosyltransferase